MSRFSLACLTCLSLSACGGVSVESPPSPSAPAPAPTPTPRAKSLVCPGAPVEDAGDVVLWYRTDGGVVFLRHDGSSTLAHANSPDTQAYVEQVAAGGDRIALTVHTAASGPSSVELFDRRGEKLAERAFASGIVTGLFAGADGRVAFSVQSGSSSEGFVWDGGEPKSLGSWIPMGPARDGWVPVRKSWESDTTTAFVHESGATQPFHSGKGEVSRVAGRLARVDEATRELWLGSPDGTVHIPLGAFGADDALAPHVAQVRDEGFLLLRRNEWLKADLLVVGTEDQSVRYLPSGPGSFDSLSFYCNAGWPGYLTSDGSVLTARLEGAQLRVWKRREGLEQPLGLPLASIAVLGLVERAGTTAIVGSTGSDTYCGTPSDIWSSPAPDGALAGNSLQLVRNADAPRLGDFPGSFNEPSIDESGSCVLGPRFGSGSVTVDVRDLESDTVFVLPSDASVARFVW